MKLVLKEFQEVYVDRLMDQLRAAAREQARLGGQAIIFSSPTGSGKTVMAAWTIERLFAGDNESLPDPEATVLWLSDQPEINEQTRRKMLEASSVLDESKLVVVDASYDEELFAPGKVHFLNTQKLGKDKQLVTHGDDRTYTIWETINNTAHLRPGSFFVFIDEAHRGMNATPKEQSEASTIVQKFILGSPGELDPVPIILGVSATPERFRRLVESSGRNQRPVYVPIEEVRASGLLVDSIRLFYPSEKQPTDITMLEAAVRSWTEFVKHWKAYCNAQKEKIVKPILVVQVEDGAAGKLSGSPLADSVKAIDEIAEQLPAEAFAHSFQEGVEVEMGTHKVRYLSPADINDDPDVAVVFFKTSLNTGWDCPRAEVMMSFRKAIDATPIAQLVGRMVRAPLARRIETDDFLNTVCLYLPHYDEVNLNKVIQDLKSPDNPELPVDILEGKDIVTLVRRKGAEKEFAALSRVPSYTVPRVRKVTGVRRLMKLARLLAGDNIRPDAIEVARQSLLDVLSSEYGRLSKTKEFKRIVEERGRVEVKSVEWQVLGQATEGETVVLVIAKQNLDDLFQAAGRKMGEGLHMAWWKHRIEQGGSSNEHAKLEVVAFCLLPKVLDKLENEAQKLSQKWLNDYQAEMDALPENRRQYYNEVWGLASSPVVKPITYLQEIQVSRGNQSFKNHLYVDERGLFPNNANEWESRMIEEDFQKASGWLRNPDRKEWSITVPYKVGEIDKGFYPDFLATRVVKDKIVVDLVDPHNPNLADAVPKAVGLARYADKHANQFGRIELVSIVRDRVRRLNLRNEEIRDEVRGLTTSAQLERLYEKKG